MEAILLLNSKNNKSSTLTSSDLHSNIALSKKELNYILDGSILPDYLKQDQPYSGYKWKIKKKKKILGMNLAADADKFHGKNRYKLEKLKEDAIKKFKKSG